MKLVALSISTELCMAEAGLLTVIGRSAADSDSSSETWGEDGGISEKSLEVRLTRWVYEGQVTKTFFTQINFLK